MYAPPRITTLDATKLPDAPDGWKYSNLTDPTIFGDDDLANYPVLLFGSYTYTALTNIANDFKMMIVGWDMDRNLVKQIVKNGARYISKITYEAVTQRVIFTGQDLGTVFASLDELVVAPSVKYVPPSSGPVLPSTLTYAAKNNAQFPVIRSGPYSFWPASYTNGQKSFCVVVASEHGVILKLIDCPGSSVIDDITVDAEGHTIILHGQDGGTANFDYNTALACFTSSIVLTKDDFIFAAEYYNVILNDVDAMELAAKMPTIDCALCCRMVGTYSAADDSARVKRSTVGAWIGAFLGTVVGGIAGFCVGGPMGAAAGAVAGAGIGMSIGGAIPGPPDRTDLGQYQLSDVEKGNSLVGYKTFPVGPFDNTGVSENIFDSPFTRYGDLPYASAVLTLAGAKTPQAYNPHTKVLGDFPRDPRYNALTLKNGIQVTKYIFVIIKTDETVGGNPGYQMRINPEDFYPDSWPASQRVNHSQMSEGYRFWALVGDPHMQVYAAGSLYVDITNKKLLGIDTRTGHYFRSFAGQDQQVNDATLDFLGKLGYPSKDIIGYADILGYFQEYQG